MGKQRPSRRIVAIGLALAGLTTAACGAAGAASPGGSDQGAAQPLVLTTGEATIRRAADRAFLLIATEARSKNPKEAQRQNARAMTSVRAKLRDVGVTDESVRSLSYVLERQFDYVKGRDVFREFLSKNTIEVRLDDVDRIGDAIDAAVAGGATSVDGPRFDLRDRDAVEREALKQAVADARAKAEAAAEGAGGRIVRVMHVEEHGVSATAPREIAGVASLVGDLPRAPTTPMAPGEIAIRAQVTVTAALK